MVLTNILENRDSVLDNSAFHKDKVKQKMIKDAGHTLLYLPLYSPDLNPIEE
ncbi:transposase [Holospora curviuscula]|uniref:transposase n=1 Tax=Holospora curviuscula TaxID=1082868 RepID=UPI000CE57FB8